MPCLAQGSDSRWLLRRGSEGSRAVGVGAQLCPLWGFTLLRQEMMEPEFMRSEVPQSSKPVRCLFIPSNYTF